MQHLTPNSALQGGKYRITEVLGQGGFGITYLAIQSGLERKVAIKEFFMKELCERDESTSHVTLGTEGSRETVNRFREKFLKEARNIARLNHPNIVRIIDVFEENGTAYYVMEYAEGGSLADKVKREGNLSEPVATCYILQVAHALDYIHERKMNHLDVKPANIMLNEKDECVLIDFGLSKQYDAITGSQTSTTPVGISEGYAPMEQYMQGGVGEFSPETDIYALGATFYKLLTGITPPNASFVNNESLPLDELKAKGVSNKAISVIAQAMEGRKRDRMKSVRTFIDSLDTTTTSSAHKSSHDEETTLFTPEEQGTEAERMYTLDDIFDQFKDIFDQQQGTRDLKNIDVQASAADHKNRKEEEQKDAQNSRTKKVWIGILIGIIAVAAVILGLNNQTSNSATTKQETVSPEILSSQYTYYFKNGKQYTNIEGKEYLITDNVRRMINGKHKMLWYSDDGTVVDVEAEGTFYRDLFREGTYINYVDGTKSVGKFNINTLLEGKVYDLSGRYLRSEPDTNSIWWNLQHE